MSDTESSADGRTDTTTTDPTPDSVDAIADRIDPDEFWDTDHEDIGIYDFVRHRNGDVTAILLCSFADGWQGLALEVDSAGEVLETEVIGYAQDPKKAFHMCEYWNQQNPKGILGGEPESQGVMATIRGVFGGGEA